jgi:hypothetical protein
MAYCLCCDSGGSFLFAQIDINCSMKTSDYIMFFTLAIIAGGAIAGIIKGLGWIAWIVLLIAIAGSIVYGFTRDEA